MKKLYLFVLFSITFISTHYAQPGFNQWFDFDSGASFHNVMLKEDTLIVAGTVLDQEADQWGALFLKMDTLGNILDYHLHLDSNGGQLAFNQKYPLIYDSNQSLHILTGDVFDRESDFILLLAENGDLLKFIELPYPEGIRTSRVRAIYPLEEGYIVFLHRQIENYKMQLSMAQLDTNGNILWEKLYAHPFDDSAILSDVWQKDANTFVIGSSFGYTDHLDAENSWTKSWIFAVDSLGNVLWEKEGENEGSVQGIQQLDNGDWAYSARAFYPSPYVSFDFYFKPKVVRRDSNFNLLWQYEMAHSQIWHNETIDMAIAPDGSFLGIGNWGYTPVSDTPDEDTFFGGCLYNISDMGDSLWIQCDTGIVNGYTTHNYLGGMVVLPGGSIIAVGSFSALDGNNRPVGWVLKRDKHGCMEELCVVTGLEGLEASPSAAAVKVYPNPAREQVFFEWEDGRQYKSGLLIYNLTGQLVHTANNIGTSYQWEVSQVPNGIYIYQVIEQGLVVASGKVAIQQQ